MANPTPESAGKTPPPPPSKTSLSQALFKILKDPDPADSDPQKVVLRRRRFVIAAVLGVLGVNFLMFLRFFFPRALYEPKTRFRIGYPFGLRLRRGHQVPKSIPHLGGAQHRGHLRHLRHLHAPGLHARTGSPARTNSSARAMAAGTIRKASTSKVPRPGPWIAPTWNSIPKARSSWI